MMNYNITCYAEGAVKQLQSSAWSPPFWGAGHGSGGESLD